jgi:hypothetical protein
MMERDPAWIKAKEEVEKDLDPDFSPSESDMDSDEKDTEVCY